MAGFDCHVIVTRVSGQQTAPGTQGADGLWTARPNVPQTITLYDGPADVQDTVTRTVRDAMGRPNDKANGLVYLMLEEKIGLIQTDDQCEIHWPDQTVEQAIVSEVRRLDGLLIIERLRPKVR